ncbi:MAG: hypothetical protein K2X93_22805 [Candidatus Obscuribacterales bacterium]|nr:hypothetical protein [Candidatus Obscuribacterales bacterium]
MFSWKNIGLVKLFGSLLGRKSKRKGSLDSPWQCDLDHLASKYQENPMRPTTYSSKTDEAVEAEAMLKKLCDEVQESFPDSDRIVVRKDRRQQDTTSVDMKAWWGQAVATWDPINAKNIDSVDQQRRPRLSKWFDSK